MEGNGREYNDKSQPFAFCFRNGLETELCNLVYDFLLSCVGRRKSQPHRCGDESNGCCQGHWQHFAKALPQSWLRRPLETRYSSGYSNCRLLPISRPSPQTMGGIFLSQKRDTI